MISRRRLAGGLLLGTGAACGLGPNLVWARSADASSETSRALHALNRLAYGPRPADIQALQAQGAQAWLDNFLLEQLEPQRLNMPTALASRLQGLDTLELSQAELLGRFRRVVQAATSAAPPRASEAGGPNTMDGAMGTTMGSAGADGGNAEAAQTRARREYVRPVVLQAAQARLARAIESPAQLQEVLVEFWFNHFNVFIGKGPVSVLAGAYEREAVRPHVLGRFRDLLGATAKHPAMLLYLDNAQSVKPGYRAPALQAMANPNAARLSGLNENYARELMELHTLGVDGGYTQQDVTELARMLTGWTIDGRSARLGRSGPLFVFDPSRHDNGVKHWMGHTIEPAGQSEGERALDVLAAHPATARHIAYKLAQAFVADQPPAALVSRLAERFLNTQGDLKAVMRELMGSDEFWQPQRYGVKFKTPYHYLISSLRALGLGTPADVGPLLQVLAQSGMPLYGAQTPDGYKNVASAWMSPEAFAQRVQFASNLAERRARQGARLDADAQRLMDALGPLWNPATREAVNAEPAPLRLALLLSSPEFMKR
ncbi:MAG: hypothetical protein RI972_2115 [Pseudomonadota bacterium]